MVEEGGGASRSTDPAAGTSAATDVSLREYLWREINAVERRSEARFEAQEKATRVALDAATKLAETHNDLLRQMERKDATYSTSRELQEFKDEREHRLDDLRDGLVERMTTYHEQASANLASYKETNNTRIERLETFQIRLGTVAALLAIIGVANLVKLWFG